MNVIVSFACTAELVKIEPRLTFHLQLAPPLSRIQIAKSWSSSKRLCSRKAFKETPSRI